MPMFSMPSSRKVMMPVMGMVSHWQSSHSAQGRNTSHVDMKRDVCLYPTPAVDFYDVCFFVLLLLLHFSFRPDKRHQAGGQVEARHVPAPSSLPLAFSFSFLEFFFD